MPMRLGSSDSEVEFELALIDARLEDLQDTGGDRFATISFRVGTADDSWEETAPSLNLFQLSSLADWLEAVGGARPELERVELLESNLSFELEDESEEEVTLVIGFHLEDRPEWAVIDAPTEEAGFIRLRLTREEVGRAGRELRDDLRATGWA
ncbi:MAG TPA: hypothetical protein VFF69_12035 [Phycisphaerales bacterium]|nr:hypothetical protein [Phycisphaerales bacterium]